MAYTINLTNGTTLTTIADGTVNQTSTSLTLIGKNYAGYGTFLNDNFVHLLENASNDTAPTTPITGQLWWDTAGNLKVYTGSGFKTISGTFVSSSTPTTNPSPVTGNHWWDTANQQLNVYNGSSWTLVGPAFTSNTGTSGTIVGTIIDSGNTSHVAVNVYVSNTLIGIYSKDSSYTPGTAITGFTTIKPGFNLVSPSTVSGATLWGTASDASGLGNVALTNYNGNGRQALLGNGTWGPVGGTPGGNSTTIQYNNSGSLAGSGNLTFDGTTLTAAGLSGPLNGTVGATTPTTGAFTTLSASSTVSGTGFSTYLASPPAIGGTLAAAGSFTTLSASSTVSGTGFSTYLASPPAIGGTAAAAGSFTNLSSSGTVSGKIGRAHV